MKGTDRKTVFVILVAVAIVIVVIALSSRPTPAGLMTKEKARTMADETIKTKFPDLLGVEPTEDEYSYEGDSFYEFVYGRESTIAVDGEEIKVPVIVTITIDKNTGAETVSDSF